MVTLCKASKTQSTKYFCCLIIAKFPRAWDGKAEACCAITVNYPGGEATSGSSAVATFSFLSFPPSLRLQDSVTASAVARECGTKATEPARSVMVIPFRRWGTGGEFLSYPKDRQKHGQTSIGAPCPVGLPLGPLVMG